jgi:protein TonB
MSGSRIIAIILVVLIHLALGYALITGLAYSAFEQVVERVTAVDVTEEPPPPPEELPPPPPINVSRAPPPIQVQTQLPPPAPPARIIPPAAPPAPPPAPPPPPPPPSQARAASPDGQSRWAARIQENYPSRAIRDEVEGRVGVNVSIGANGRVASCSVSSSSGSSILDQAACDGMERYARFNPALDDAGNPTTGSYSTTIVYQLGR